MADNFFDRLSHGWNAFTGQKQQGPFEYSMGGASTLAPYRRRMSTANDKSVVSSVLTRISIDASAIEMRHIKMDENDRYLQSVDSGLNSCLNLEANIDQAATAFRQDVVLTMLDKGFIAIVPVDTGNNPDETGSLDIKTLRVGEIVAWYPQHVKVNVYNDRVGRRQDITLPKSVVAIVYNPLYSVMNEPNSTLQRLLRKLGMLDQVDEASSSGKLDIIIQLPYTIRTETKRQQADQRARDIESQLKGSHYGIAYADATEKITQLNRPAENNMLAQIEYLTKMLYGQLGLTEAVFDGTADEATMLNYYNRTIEPILTAVTESLKRTFLTKTARTQRQSIAYYRDPFKLVPVGTIAEIADKFARNEILSSNEIRSLIGFKPSPDPKADQLINSNMPNGQPAITASGEPQELTATPVATPSPQVDVERVMSTPVSQLALTQ